MAKMLSALTYFLLNSFELTNYTSPNGADFNRNKLPNEIWREIHNFILKFMI